VHNFYQRHEIMEECLTVDFNERPSFAGILPKLENCVIPDHLEVK
jgi:hypothetical protein